MAATELIRKVGGVVVESLVVMELVGLEGRKRLDGKVHSLIKYWELIELWRSLLHLHLPIQLANFYEN